MKDDLDVLTEVKIRRLRRAPSRAGFMVVQVKLPYGTIQGRFSEISLTEGKLTLVPLGNTIHCPDETNQRWSTIEMPIDAPLPEALLAENDAEDSELPG